MINYDEAKYSSNTLAQVIMRIDLSNPMSNEKLFSDSREAKILEYFPNAGMIQKDKEALIHLSLPEPQWEPKPVRDILRKEYSNETANLIDKEVKRLIDESYANAEDLIHTNKDKVELIANAL